MPFEWSLARQFSTAQIDEMWEIAQLRARHFSEHGNHIDGPHRCPENNFAGVVAEVAACGWLGGDISRTLNFNPALLHDGGVDVVMGCGQVVQVKASRRRTPRMIVPPHQLPTHPRSIYLLVGTIDESTVWPGGWCWGYEYEARSHQRDFGKGLGLQPVIDAENLRSLKQFLNRIEYLLA